MAMRLSGLMSGMDTESLISQLVEARKTKVNKVKKTQVSFNYKQEAWKDLNTKLKNLQAKYIGNMRFASSYMKKTTKISNATAASVITGEKAVNGVQSLEVKQLAKTGYLTGRQLSENGAYTAMTKLSDLDSNMQAGSFVVETGSTRAEIAVDGNTTISDVLNKLKDVGLNANFDAKNQRFFISAKESGSQNDFSITASDAAGQTALKALGLQVNLNEDKATLAKYQELAAYTKATTTDAEIKTNMLGLIDKEIADRVASYQKRYTALMESRDAAIKKLADNAYKDADLDTSANYASLIEEKNNSIKSAQESIDSGLLTDAEKAEMESRIATLKDEVKELEEKRTAAIQKENIAKIDAEIESFVADPAKGREGYVTISPSEVDGKTVYTAAATTKLQDEVADKLVAQAKYAAQVMADYEASGGASNKDATGATKVTAQDAVITLNNATFTNATNVFEINGLTITALNETKEGEQVTLTTQNDTDGIYDMVKEFLKEYNAIINEMDKLYNAASVGSLEPLLSEEKSALTDAEVEDVEKKLKESILRRDDNLSSVSAGLREVMAGGFTVNGKTMYLHDFGIAQLGYFMAPDNEKNAYHIDGDPDDENTSGNADKLKSMISSDPDTVVSFFTQLAQSLYSKMSSMSKSVDGYRSYGSFYDDKKMKEDYNSYNSKIADLEQKLNDYEDSWYKKFSKMETAMAKMQSNANALTGLLGGN